MYAFLVVGVNTYKKSGKVTLNQVGLTNKVLKTLGILDGNKKTAPAETMPLVTDADEPPFDETWEYASVVVILMHISNYSRPDIQFDMYQWGMFTQNLMISHADSVKMICLYLVVMQGQFLIFNRNSDMSMDCYVDA